MDTTKVLQAIETLHAAGLLKWEAFYGGETIEATLGSNRPVALVNHDNGEVHLNFGDSKFVGEKSPLGDVIVPKGSPLAKIAKAAAAQTAGASK
jgi:hypothetical protein